MRYVYMLDRWDGKEFGYRRLRPKSFFSSLYTYKCILWHWVLKARTYVRYFMWQDSPVWGCSIKWRILDSPGIQTAHDTGMCEYLKHTVPALLTTHTIVPLNDDITSRSNCGRKKLVTTPDLIPSCPQILSFQELTSCPFCCLLQQSHGQATLNLHRAWMGSRKGRIYGGWRTKSMGGSPGELSEELVT